MRRAICPLICVGVWSVVTGADAEARRSLSAEGDTVETALAEAQEAARTSNMRVTLSTVGFRIAPGSAAESYLQETARIGSGAYFRAAEGGQLSAAVGAAAAGRTSAGSPEAVVIHEPKDGEVVGPHVEVVGRTVPNALVIAYTVAFDADTGKQVRKVPGFRRRASDTGDFAFRMATPRISFGDQNTPMRYEVHAYIAHRDGRTGPETVINLYSQKPAK